MTQRKHAFCSWLFLFTAFTTGYAQPLPDTRPLTHDGDLLSEIQTGVDEFLDRQTQLASQRRWNDWRTILTSGADSSRKMEIKRKKLSEIVGLKDVRIPFDQPEKIANFGTQDLVGTGKNFEAVRIRWPAFADVEGEGLLLEPAGQPPKAFIIAIPDCEQSPEQLAGLEPGIPPESQYARRLAESGCRVVIPVLINRSYTHFHCPNREFVYRGAYEMGRHLIGYEIQKILALGDWANRSLPNTPIGAMGWGEGGLLAFYAGALDTRFSAVCVSGYFENRSSLWQEPLDRNLFGLLEEFADAEIAAMISPRTLLIEAAKGPELTLPPEAVSQEKKKYQGAGADGRLKTPDLESVQNEFQHAKELLEGVTPVSRMELIRSGDGTGPYGTENVLARFLNALHTDLSLAPLGPAPEYRNITFDSNARQNRQFRQLVRHNEQLLCQSRAERDAFWKKLDTKDLDTFQKSAQWYRDYFYQEVIGRFDMPLSPANPQSRRIYDEPQYTGYEATLDVFEGVIAYGILLVPKDIPPGEKRPVVVCQHGLEGCPRYVIEKDNEGYGFYQQYAARLAERGFVTFAPQNLYRGGERFRLLQRKANPLKKTLFSIMVPQQQQIVNWLSTLPFADGKRIAFYGLSYGGFSAMRIPPLVPGYCLSICSGNFTDWITKTVSTHPADTWSYMRYNSYEIYEWNLGSTFNYSDMAALIAPRPFMVERGYEDRVSPDDLIGSEFARVQKLYEYRLHLPDRCRIERFPGKHKINGVGTFEFLHHYLQQPNP